jgi:hypothetical protein
VAHVIAVNPVLPDHDRERSFWPVTLPIDWCYEWVPKEGDPGDVLDRCVARLSKLADDTSPGHYRMAVQECLSIIEEERIR